MIETVAYVLIFIQPLFAACGLWYTIFEMRDAVRDYEVARSSNGIKLTGTLYNLYQTRIRAACQLILLFIGASTLLSPPSPMIIFDRTASVIFNRGGLILLTLLLMLKSLNARRYRRDIIAFWLGREGQQP